MDARGLGCCLVGYSGSRWTVSGEKAGRQTATYSAPSGPGVVEEMQAPLGAYLEAYNRNCPHRGRGMEGRTPYQVFRAVIREAQESEEVNQE